MEHLLEFVLNEAELGEVFGGQQELVSIDCGGGPFYPDVMM